MVAIILRHIQNVLAVFLFLFVSLVFAPSVAALENPQALYDWNRYQPEYSQVLGRAFAQEATGIEQPKEGHRFYKQFSYPLPFTGDWKPDHPLYFFKRVEETTVLALTFDPKVKEERRLGVAGERLWELERIADEGKTQYIASLSRSYNQTVDTITAALERLHERGIDAADITAAADVEFSKHTLVLEEVALKVPLQAEAGIQIALAASEKGVDTVADITGRPAMPPDVVTRLQSLKAQGILSEEEVTKLVGVESRQQAREELRKYTSARLIPEADFKKLDESAKYYFPEGYHTAVEIKKFREVKALETEKPDNETLGRVQEFAKTYKTGDLVPPGLRRWWVPMVRLEELNNTVRPDLIQKDWLRNRPEDYQKYQEIVERVKPRPEDVTFVNGLLRENPNLSNDPAYQRIKILADTFGASCPTNLTWIPVAGMQSGGYCGKEASMPPPIVDPTNRVCGQAMTPAQGPNGECAVFSNACIPDGWSRASSCSVEVRRAPGESLVQACEQGKHWVSVPFMPNGGYCVPNYDYPVDRRDRIDGRAPVLCPPGYHRTSPESSCYPDNPTDGGFMGQLPAPGSCQSGYSWVSEAGMGGRRGYCQPDYATNRGGYPSPIMPPSYCPEGKMFRDGKCETYSPPPIGGCPEKSWWNGQKCVDQKDCGQGKYQDSNGDCKSTSEEYRRYTNQCAGRPMPQEGCGAGYWDMASCSCRYQPDTSRGGTSCPPGYRAMPLPQSGFECVKEGGTATDGSGTSYDMSKDNQEATCRAGGGTCSWSGNTCNCQGYRSPYAGNSGGSSASSTGTGSSGGTSSGTNPGASCGPGYYWTGSYCAMSGSSGSSGGGSPSGTYTPPSGNPYPPSSTPSYSQSSYTPPSYSPPSDSSSTSQPSSPAPQESAPAPSSGSSGGESSSPPQGGDSGSSSGGSYAPPGGPCPGSPGCM